MFKELFKKSVPSNNNFEFEETCSEIENSMRKSSLLCETIKTLL